MSVDATSVTLTTRDAVAVEVSAEIGASGTGTLMFTADDYATATVTVAIIDDDLQTIGLAVVGSTELSLVRFSTTDITVSVDVATDLTVKAEGAVSLEGGAPSAYRLTEGALSQQIQIEAVSIGEGTITFTASGAGQSTATEMVTVTVSTPALVISDVSALAINLVARTTTGLTVRVSAEAGVPESVTLTATVSGEAGRVVSVNPMERVIETVSVDTPAMFTVEGLDAGRTTLTLTARHPDYESASIDVSVSVYLPGVELSVSPPSLQFEQGATGLLTVAVSASTEATITISSDPSNIVSVLSQPFTLMGGASNNSTMIEVSGVGIGRTTLTIEASADGYATETATVIVEIQNRFRIAAMPDMLSLVEDGASTEISVSLNRIDTDSGTVTVTINLQEGSELTVMPSSLEFTGTETQTVTVTATNVGGDYTDIRIEILTLASTNYTTATVTVEITDDDLQTIGLIVVGTTERNLVRFTTTDITVSADVATDLTVKAEGAVSLEGGAPLAYRLTEGALSQQIQIEAVSIGEGTITFTASGAGQSTATEMVRVMVSTPALVISDVSALAINLVARTTTGLTVRVSAEAGVPEDVTLTATVSGEAGRVVSVNPMERVIETVSVDTPAMFTVEGLDAGRTTLTLTAIHSDYELASTEVIVMVYLPGVELSVSPPSLQFEQGATGLLTVAVSASTEATITISSDPSNIVSVLSQPFTLMGGASNNSTMIEVSGVNIGRTTLTIEAVAAGYETTRATVEVNVIESLRIVAEPGDVDLVAGGGSTQIDVSVSRLVGGSVTVAIDASAGLSVDATSVTLTTRDAVAVEVSAEIGASGTGTLMFTATDYATARVTVEIEAAPTEPDPPVGLVVVPRVLEIVTEGSTELSITVSTTATITIAGGDARASVEAGAARFTLIGGADNSTQIDVFGVRSGTTTLTIEAVAAGYETTRATVEVNVIESLRIVAEPGDVDLVAGGGSTQIDVSVSRLVGGSVTVAIDASAGLSVDATSVTLTTRDAVAVEVSAAADSSGTGRLTFTATDYATATVTVEITDDDLQTIGLIVEGTTERNLVRFSTTDITVSVDIATDLTVKAEGAVSLEGGAPSAYRLTEGALSQQIQIEAVSVGAGTITFTASGAGQSTATEMVTVTVSTPALVISDVSALAINLVARTTTGLTVRVSAEAGVPESVTLTATVSGEAGRVVSVNPMKRVIETVSVDTPVMFTVEGLDAGRTTLTLTAIHSDYELASTEVIVMVYLPGVELSVSPPSLQFEQGATGLLTVAVSASTQATIRIRSGNDPI